ncbi:universal stress protein [Reyranella sp.]|uniref:universal stress protein n=1 Tax=Reyranella sp. TaxID=1929291 RepID=UPI0037830A2F
MSYRTLMTMPILGQTNAVLLESTARLARKLDAAVIGVAACRPVHAVCRDYAIPAGVFEEDRKQIERQIHDTEVQFRSALSDHSGSVQWRAHACLEPLASRLARESALADLIVVSLAADGKPGDTTRQPDLCDLVMQAGRPVLLVPSAQPLAGLDRVLIAWKDTREARRAVADGLPLLAKATEVTVVAIGDSRDAADAHSGIARVQAWLARHDIAAKAKTVPPHRANAQQLIGIAREMKADLVVAGASGYVRQGRWVLGGITSELLSGDTCALVSH